jgi:hypothetical protein
MFNLTEDFSISAVRWKLYENRFDEPELLILEFSHYKDEDTLANVLELYKFPTFMPIDREHMYEILQQGKPSLLYIYGNETNELEHREFNRTLIELSKKYRNDILFTFAHYEDAIFSILHKLYYIQPHHLPYILITTARPNSAFEMDKYRLEKMKPMEIKKFINDWKNGKQSSFLISEDLPVEKETDLK